MNIVRPRVYIAGAISPTNKGEHPLLKWGDNENKFMKMDVRLRLAGFAPFNPALDYSLYFYGANLLSDSDFYEVSLAFLGQCEAMIVLNGWENSKGTKVEIEFCKEKGIPIFFEDKSGFTELLKYFGRNGLYYG